MTWQNNIARTLTVCTCVALASAACGDTSDKAVGNNSSADAGTPSSDSGTSESDTGTADTGTPVDCDDDEVELDGECLKGALDVRLLGSEDRFTGTGSLISWAADKGPLVETVEVTSTCVYGRVESNGAPPVAPDCLDAGSIELTLGDESETIEQGENCYQNNFEPIREWGGSAIDVAVSGGTDFDAVSLTLDIPPAPTLEIPDPTEGVVVRRMNAEVSDNPIIFILPDGDAPMIQCTETTPGELRLSESDVAAIQAVEGEHTDLLVIHTNFSYAVDPPYYFNVAAQNNNSVLGFLPSE